MRSANRRQLNSENSVMAAVARRTVSWLLFQELNASCRSIQTSRLAAAVSAAAAVGERLHPFAFQLAAVPIRWKTTSGSGYSPLNESSSNWNNRPPKETILLDGCDYEHWLIVMEFPKNPKPSEEEMVAAYVKTLATVVGSEQEATKKIYSVCTSTYTGFGALISEELSYKVKGLPGVLWVLPDSYLDVPNKDYGGDLFVDGKVIHRPQFRITQQPSRNRPRSRYDRHCDMVQVLRREPVQGGLPGSHEAYDNPY